MRTILHATMKAMLVCTITASSANMSSDQMLKTINQVIPKVGGAILGLADVEIK